MKLRLPGFLSILILLILPFTSCRKKLDASELNGQWVGHYGCAKEESGVIMTLEGNEGDVTATLDYHGSPTVASIPIGQVVLNGTYDRDGKLVLDINREYDHCLAFVETIEVVVDDSKTSFTGHFTGPGRNCNDFTLVKHVGGIDGGDVAGSWAGTYTCDQESFDLSLEIVAEGIHLIAVLSYFELSSEEDVPVGSFQMKGIYNGAGIIDLEATTWISQPPDHATISLEGLFTKDGEDRIRGNVQRFGQQCEGSFELSRK